MALNDRKSGNSNNVAKRAHQHDVRLVDKNGNPVAARRQEMYEGAIPHPDHFQGFEDVLPGAANRILLLTENEQAAAHEARRRDQDFRDRVLDARQSENKHKQHIALAALALCLGTSLGLAALGAYVAAATVGGTTVVAVIAAFLGHQIKELKESKAAPAAKEETSKQEVTKTAPKPKGR